MTEEEYEKKERDDEAACLAAMPFAGVLMKIGAPCPEHKDGYLRDINYGMHTYVCSTSGTPHDWPMLAFQQQGSAAVHMPAQGEWLMATEHQIEEVTAEANAAVAAPRIKIKTDYTPAELPGPTMADLKAAIVELVAIAKSHAPMVQEARIAEILAMAQ